MAYYILAEAVLEGGRINSILQEVQRHAAGFQALGKPS